MLLSIVETNETVTLLICCALVDALDANVVFETITDDKLPLFVELVVFFTIVGVEIDVIGARYVVLTATFDIVLPTEPTVVAVE